jgi:hypothetical protein
MGQVKVVEGRMEEQEDRASPLRPRQPAVDALEPVDQARAEKRRTSLHSTTDLC